MEGLESATGTPDEPPAPAVWTVWIGRWKSRRSAPDVDAACPFMKASPVVESGVCHSAQVRREERCRMAVTEGDSIYGRPPTRRRPGVAEVVAYTSIVKVDALWL